MALSRSQQMARIRSKHTRPEEILRRLLWSRGFRYRLHVRVDGCRPDLVFRKSSVLVFIDGCFWHGCPVHYVRPRSRDGFWSEKLLANVERDVRQTRELEKRGWRVCRLWEHEVFEAPEGALGAVEGAIRSAGWTPPRSWRVDHVDPVAGAGDLEKRHLRELRGLGKPRTLERTRSTRKWRIHESLK
jgi:DNA mismatch endonuclease (patch repair protein)